MKKIVTVLIFVVIFTSCKTAKVSDKSVDYVPVKAIIKNNNKEISVEIKRKVKKFKTGF